MDGQRAVGIDLALGAAVEPADAPAAPRMVVAVLAARRRVQVQAHAETLGPRPLDPAEQVPPRRARHIWVAVVRLNGPVRETEAYVVEAGGSDRRKGLAADKRRVVLLQHLCGALRPKRQAEGVLVDDRRYLWCRRSRVEEGGGDEGFCAEPAAKVHTADGDAAVVPGLVKRWHGGICADGVGVGSVESHDR